MAERDGAFLKRWARRKAAVEQDAAASSPPAKRDVDTRNTATPPGEEVPPDLPNIDELGQDSDYSVFLQDAVPSALRKQALRKLWKLDPAFSELDGLVEYGEDYSAKVFARRCAEGARKAGEAARQGERQAERLQEQTAESESGVADEDPEDSDPEAPEPRKPTSET